MTRKNQADDDALWNATVQSVMDDIRRKRRWDWFNPNERRPWHPHFRLLLFIDRALYIAIAALGIAFVVVVALALAAPYLK